MTRVLVTGGAGFVGVNLARSVQPLGWSMIAFDDLSTGRRDDASAAGYDDLIVGDVRDAAAVLAAAEGVDAIVHLAAQTGVPGSLADPVFDMSVNVAGTVNVLEAARATEVPVVLASSAAPIGRSAPPAHEDIVPRPLSPYGASKLALEGYASAYEGSYGLPVSVLRFSNVYGPFSYLKGSVVAKWMRTLMSGERISINGDGSQTRDFVYVADICDAISSSISREATGLFQLGTGVETSVLDLAGRMAGLFGVDVSEIEFAEPLPGEVPRSFTRIDRAAAALGYRPAVQLEHGLELTKVWFDEWFDREEAA